MTSDSFRLWATAKEISTTPPCERSVNPRVRFAESLMIAFEDVKRRVNLEYRALVARFARQYSVLVLVLIDKTQTIASPSYKRVTRTLSLPILKVSCIGSLPFKEGASFTGRMSFPEILNKNRPQSTNTPN